MRFSSPSVLSHSRVGLAPPEAPRLGSVAQGVSGLRRTFAPTEVQRQTWFGLFQDWLVGVRASAWHRLSAIEEVPAGCSQEAPSGCTM